jgi:predicted permease
MLIAKIRSYVDSLLHRSRREDEIADELQFHVESRAADLERGGLTSAEALRRARVEFGGVETHRAEIRASLGLRWMDELSGDLRYAWRMLWRSKGFTAVAIGSLALGIGANTIIFSLAKGVLLDRLAVPHPEQLRLFELSKNDQSPVNVFWGGQSMGADGKPLLNSYSYPVYQLLRQQNLAHPVVGDIFAFKDLNGPITPTIKVDGHTDVVSAEMVSGNYYEQMGVRPTLGRAIAPSDDVPGAPAVAVLSDGLWTRLFGRSPAAIGKTINLNMVPVTIIGINPPEFTGAGSVQISPEIFFPLSLAPTILNGILPGPLGEVSLLTNKTLWWVQLMARALPGATEQKANAAFNVWLGQDIQATVPVRKDAQMPKLILAPGSQGLGMANQQYASPLYVLLGLTGFVLLLACTNLANLLLARSAARQREMSVRLALGATRGRVLRQVLTESLLLSFLGGLAGFALGYVVRNVIPNLLSASWRPAPLTSRFNLDIFAFTAGVSIVTGVVFGLAPAWQATRTNVNTSLKDAATSSTRRRKGLGGKVLVVVQVALSMVLVVGAGLFSRTLMNLNSSPLGLNPKDIQLFAIQVPGLRYPAPKDVELHERIEDRLAGLPGVQSVTLVEDPLLGNYISTTGFQPTDQPKLNNYDSIMENGVGPDFFKTYQIPILYGRSFVLTDTSTSPLAAVINEKIARKFYPNANPVGKTFTSGNGDKDIYQIIGVAADAHYDELQGEPPPTIYRDYRQSKKEPMMTYAVKTSVPSAAIMPVIRKAVTDIDKDLPIRDVRTQVEQMVATISQQRLFAMLTAGFGFLALVLACIGIYGVMAYNVARRTNEIGIRMALGARTGQMLRMVLGETSWLAVVGIGIGLGAALLLTKYVKSMLYGLTPNDPWILGGAGVLLLGVALLAGWGPARRASRVEPMEALRHE